MASKISNKGLKRSALSIALGMCFASSMVLAQSTSGGIFGSVPAGSTVTISNNSGISRTVTADANGRYAAGNLPVGNYTVTAGGVKRQVLVTVGGNANVSFVGAAANIGTVTVTGTSGPQIDVTSVDTRTIITAEELRRLPIARTAESIALLSPGAVPGNGAFFGGEIAFGGSSVAENAYYLNGYFSGNPLTNIGGFTLPYGSIEQQETYTGGYGAKYGRSAGGVISQVGKAGSNDWHFGGQVVFEPKSLKSVRPDRFYPNLSFAQANANPNLPHTCGEDLNDDGIGDELCQFTYSSPDLAGTAYDRGEDRKSWQNIYSGYLSGPIIQDKLFFFLSAEQTAGNRNVPAGSPNAGFASVGSKYGSDETKVYAKVNWNITDNHLLEFTYVADKYKEKGKTYVFDYDTYMYGAYKQPATGTKSNTEYSILRYTGYLTDNVTVTANYGKSRNRYDTFPFLTGSPRLAGQTSENPYYFIGGKPIRNSQALYRTTKDADEYTDGLRLELEWVLGDHTLNFGLDNTTLEGVNQGTSQVAPAFTYGKALSGTTNVSSSLGVGPTGTGPGACNPLTSKCGYYVYKLKFFDTTSMKNKQKAIYLEDKWQITPNLLLSLGLRSDTYQNFSDIGVKFVDSGRQLQPRLGFAWDVNGDSSFKVFGNAGRYFLNLPNAVAIRGVGASTFTREYFTYTGIAADGTPTGLTPINVKGGTTPAGPVSSNGEFGGPKDPLTYVPEDLKSQYQDEYVLGFEAALTPDWAMGGKLTYRDLKSAVDDVCDPFTLATAGGLSITRPYDYSRAAYIAEDPSTHKLYATSGCYIFNPGGSNTYALQEVVPNTDPATRATRPYNNVDGSYDRLKISSSQLGFDGLRRTYKALDLFLDRKWDGKWEARFDYTWSKSQGNSEGPANSDTGQGSNAHDNGVATSQNFDAYQINAFADGYLPNDRTHQFKAHGAYALTPEWLVSANVRIASGAPLSCFGYYDPTGSIAHDSDAADPIGYGDSYHTCFGSAFTPGKERTPWTHRVDAAVTYKPSYFDHKLAVTLNAFNVFNNRTVTSSYSYSEDDGPYSVNADYRLPQSYTAPRYVQLSVSYDY